MHRKFARDLQSYISQSRFPGRSCSATRARTRTSSSLFTTHIFYMVHTSLNSMFTRARAAAFPFGAASRVNAAVRAVLLAGPGSTHTRHNQRTTHNPIQHTTIAHLARACAVHHSWVCESRGSCVRCVHASLESVSAMRCVVRCACGLRLSNNAKLTASARVCAQLYNNKGLASRRARGVPGYARTHARCKSRISRSNY